MIMSDPFNCRRFPQLGIPRPPTPPGVLPSVWTRKCLFLPVLSLLEVICDSYRSILTVSEVASSGF